MTDNFLGRDGNKVHDRPVKTRLLMLWVLAETTVESWTGGSGWAGAGLLGLVLAWLLLKHLPAKDQQLKDYLTEKDDNYKAALEDNEQRRDALVQNFREESKEARSEFKVVLETILKHCEDETRKMSDAVREELKMFRNVARHE